MEGMCSNSKKLCPTAIASIRYLYAHRADIWFITQDVFLISLASDICIRFYSRAKNLSNFMQLVVAACIGGIGLLVPYKDPLFSLVAALVILLAGAVFALGLQMRKKIGNKVAKGRSANMQARIKREFENSELDGWAKRTWVLLF